MFFFLFLSIFQHLKEKRYEQDANELFDMQNKDINIILDRNEKTKLVRMKNSPIPEPDPVMRATRGGPIFILLLLSLFFLDLLLYLYLSILHDNTVQRNSLPAAAAAAAFLSLTHTHDNT